MMNVTYWRYFCFYNETRKECFDEGAYSKAARRLGHAADSVLPRYGEGRSGSLAYPPIFRLAFSLFSCLSCYAGIKKETNQPLSKVDIFLQFSSLQLLLAAVIHKPSFIWLAFSLLPLFLIHVYYARQKNERALLNDFAGVLFFCTGGLASCWLGTETLDGWAWFIFAQSALFFIGSSFYVKSVIREKNNRVFAYWSWGYHLILPLLSAALGGGWAVLAFIPSSLRAWFFHGKKWPVQTIGILEIVNACFFFAIMCIWLTR